MTKTMHDNIVMVTGATDGIGRQTAIDLAEMGAMVIVHGRNKDKVAEVEKVIRKRTGKSFSFPVVADLSSMTEIQRMSDEIHQQFDRIDVLINNAGVYLNERQLNSNGLEMTFSVNHLSYFLLTGMLIDLIGKSEDGRVINVASQAHSSQLNFNNLQGEQQYDGYDAYSRSKLCNILFTYRRAGMLKSNQISVNALHPGVIRTKLLHAGWGSGGSELSHGSKTSVYLATSCEVAGISGKYFSGQRVVPSSDISYDKQVQDKLWEESEKLTGFVYPESDE